jgi:gliding motility-associated-like protein
LNNLDEILKQQMQDFAPDAPNIWAGIEQGMQANAAAQSGLAGSKVVLSKLALTVIKVTAILAIPTSVATYFYTKNSKKENIERESKVAELKVPIAVNSREISLDKTQVTDKPKQTFTNNEKYVSNSLIKTQEAYINDNFIEHKLNVENKQQEGLNNKNLEQTVTPIVVTEIIANPTIPEIDLDDKIDSIENIENNFEATETYKNESAFIKTPNVLTPNNDGLNDRYVIEIEGEKLFNLKIYNFNNELVFESNDKNFTWDGVSQKTGQPCNSGVYYGVLNFKFINSDKLQTQMTKIKLIR